MLAYISDSFLQLNQLSTSIQAREIHIVKACEKLKSFKQTLPVWSRRIKAGIFTGFSELEVTVKEFGCIFPGVQQEIFAHFDMLQASLDRYFSAGELSVSEQWTIDPFLFNVDQMSDGDVLKEDLIDLKENQAMKLLFDTTKLESFWCSNMESYRKLSEKALSFLVPFKTTYLCESGFSSLIYLKNKYRNRLNPSKDLRVALSNCVAMYDRMISGKQQQKCH